MAVGEIIILMETKLETWWLQILVGINGVGKDFLDGYRWDKTLMFKLVGFGMDSWWNYWWLNKFKVISVNIRDRDHFYGSVYRNNIMTIIPFVCVKLLW